MDGRVPGNLIRHGYQQYVDLYVVDHVFAKPLALCNIVKLRVYGMLC